MGISWVRRAIALSAAINLSPFEVSAISFYRMRPVRRHAVIYASFNNVPRRKAYLEVSNKAGSRIVTIHTPISITCFTRRKVFSIKEGLFLLLPSCGAEAGYGSPTNPIVYSHLVQQIATLNYRIRLPGGYKSGYRSEPEEAVWRVWLGQSSPAASLPIRQRRRFLVHQGRMTNSGLLPPLIP